MRKPFYKVPSLCHWNLCGIVYESDFHIGVAVVSCNLGDERADNLRPAVCFSDHTDETFGLQIYADRHIMHHAEAIPDHIRLSARESSIILNLLFGTSIFPGNGISPSPIR